jgi:hypothetical protein
LSQPFASIGKAPDRASLPRPPALRATAHRIRSAIPKPVQGAAVEHPQNEQVERAR